MIHPIFPATLRNPGLVLRHISNYGALVKAEAAEAAGGLVRQTVGVVLAAILLVLAVGLSGFAVMLGMLHGSFHWVLVVVPAVTWLCTVICGLVAIRSRLPKEIKDVREQVELDLKLLRIAKESEDG
ncbi:MAG: hypothetical protein J7605_06855 [Variovorax sp.]|nr:hypothetical protein [Variovorax sp.]